MRRKSTAVVSTSTGSEAVEEIQNTGLRPSWGEFWGVDSDYGDRYVWRSPSGERTQTHMSTRSLRSVTASTVSSRKSYKSTDPSLDQTQFRSVKFVTGSEWTGEWDKFGMCGIGIYKMPHGVIYEGSMNAGVFEGVGILRYPNGGSLEGFWHEGKLKYYQYQYADGLQRDNPLGWSYCQMPDRRFATELLSGLRPADQELRSNEMPVWEIPVGCYDVGDGIYNPRTKCVTDYRTGEILRIPTTTEEISILKFCRAGAMDTVGYCPDLYENWFRVKTEEVAERDMDQGEQVDVDEDLEKEDKVPLVSEQEKAILELILQKGGGLEATMGSIRMSQSRRLSDQSTMDSVFEPRSGTSSCALSRSLGVDIEQHFRKLFKEKVTKSTSIMSIQGRIRAGETLDGQEDSLDEVDMMKLFKEIAFAYHEIGRLEKGTLSQEHYFRKSQKDLTDELLALNTSESTISFHAKILTSQGSETISVVPQSPSTGTNVTGIDNPVDGSLKNDSNCSGGTVKSSYLLSTVYDETIDSL